MHQDEGGLIEALALGAFNHYERMIPDQVENGIGAALLCLVIGFILWRLIPAGINLHAIAETSTDQSLID